MPPRKLNAMSQVRAKAADTLCRAIEQNKELFLVQAILQNPLLNPLDFVLCYRPRFDPDCAELTMVIWLEPKKPETRGSLK